MKAKYHCIKSPRIKPLFLGLIAFACLLFGNAGGFAQNLLYSVTDLGTLPGLPDSSPTGINNNGQVVGAAYGYGGYLQAFLYSGGTMMDIGALPGDTNTTASAINNAGQAAGYTYTFNPNAPNPIGSPQAFLYSGGTMAGLGTLPGYSEAGSQANGINNAGQVVGVSYGLNQEHAFLYSGGRLNDLGTLGNPANESSEAIGINDFGQAVGVSTFNGTNYAVLFNGGTVAELGTLPGYSYSSPLGINNAGQVVGSAEDSDGNTHAVLYSGGTMMDLGALPDYAQSVATSINNAGQVVGYVFNPQGDAHAFLYSGGTMMDLNSLLLKGSEGNLVEAYGINDGGQIVCYGGNYHAVLLTPIGSVQITSVKITHSDVVLGFTTVSNGLYDVQSTTNLVSTPWSTVASNIPGAGVAMNYTNIDGASLSQKFYRICVHN